MDGKDVLAEALAFVFWACLLFGVGLLILVSRA